MIRTLLDTDALSEILKGKRRHVVSQAEEYLIQHERLTFSAITLYEIERGLISKQAVGLLAHFDSIVQVSEVLPITVPILRRAAKL